MPAERIRRLPWAMMLTSAVLGLVLAAQLNYQRRLAAGPRVDAARVDQILSLYEAQRSENEALRQRLAEVSATPTPLGAGRLEEVERRLDLLSRFAGLAPLQGPGVRAVVSDAVTPVQTDLDQNPYTVHDQDLLLMVNELWAAGAEAMAMNGQRLVGGSEIRCSGPVINVNDYGLTPPYRIEAIGDPETLNGALANLRGGIVDQLRNVGIDVRITKETNVVLPGLAREPSFRFARPAAMPATPGQGG
ncbi:MAG: DUF881 domain-containing protein [Armatimonadetes bacterium]|nr:DUF881 domain-containing protein [Armatimonadota bacterium]